MSQIVEKKLPVKKAAKSDKFSRLVELLNGLNQGKFTGYVKINYSQGSIARVEKFEEVLNLRNESRSS